MDQIEGILTSEYVRSKENKYVNCIDYYKKTKRRIFKN